MAQPIIIYAVCFDISDDRIRRNVGKILLGYGDRVQESVFEIAVKTPYQLHQLIGQLRPLLEESDKLRFYRLCANCREQSHVIGEGRIADWPNAIIIC
ncbi:CRISPR-associated endonuclease Cas2 [Vibrio gazogenes]|uniref:CRISPR-associated endoribonuclease Cas2 n=1 Tax=Vibrio gazogenes DSM 21264 = NBRC 103151 TaxID=1123492 RepID=A0A1M4VAY3_VIBGA|nr:CRISPR-associated endonuclease Cas2 [Vibrio gazogenes]USP15584.1 CRISPR-associated endonuclease Cas2 [Vibrio gazogenes]SHE66109.1 CRISPR-associated protein, Cas2 family [Vibrio gazogenes DSM 21264] [Vibrio gazogenes DSM 21264 = NBRC 103151]SJN57122.1 CRISPR-associated endoribonuclease Cas2 [Vibrio gazogenes]